ncbi:hypothetical protein HaLaN_10015 [Haematococcus lacustris]|uniref:Uncharacterized protein n=1 Tax=Haematococcus lacustris TaxID=44745 RepID=A0A699YWS2_HAELA|nr:hypothetical protein HaLaN_10015 [Haematococcus lacustris]
MCDAHGDQLWPKVWEAACRGERMTHARWMAINDSPVTHIVLRTRHVVAQWVWHVACTVTRRLSAPQPLPLLPLLRSNQKAHTYMCKACSANLGKLPPLYLLPQLSQTLGGDLLPPPSDAAATGGLPVSLAAPACPLNVTVPYACAIGYRTSGCCEIAVVKATASVPNAHFSSAFWCVCLQLATAATCAATCATGPYRAGTPTPGLADLALAWLGGLPSSTAQWGVSLCRLHSGECSARLTRPGHRTCTWVWEMHEIPYITCGKLEWRLQ